ncbi:heterokaryon incompatibility protein domain-containing protein [Trichoderma evansii]
MLCSICSSTDFAAVAHSNLKQSPTRGANNLLFYTIYRDDDTKPDLTPHQTTTAELNTAAENCDLCRVIKGFMDVATARHKKSKEMGWSSDREKEEIFLCGRIKRDGIQVLLLKSSNEKRKIDLYEVIGGLGFAVDSDSLLAPMVKGRTISPLPKDPSTLAVVKQWISHCIEKHGHAQGSAMPTRLLEIRLDGQEIVLCDSFTETHTYVALSYCWGSTKQKTLRADTIEEFRTGLGTQDLPQTFQDAIWVTRQLGIRFLWVDSLCIVQDDYQDWIAHSDRMNEVYGNATLTIAASRAQDSAEGFLSERLRTYLPIPVEMDGVSGEVFAFPLPIRQVGHPEHGMELEGEPIATRGWTLQERYLSIRTLHFGTSQIFFECAQSFLSEDHCSVGDMDYTDYHLAASARRERSKPEVNDWRKIVKQYSQRKLTVETDKLPALAGMASQLLTLSTPPEDRCMSNTSYLAGLWRDDFIYGLGWARPHSSPTGTRPQHYCGPSWSWASVHGVVGYGSWRQNRGQLARFVDAGVDLYSQQHPFGMVTRGWALLRVRLLRLVKNKHSRVGPSGIAFLSAYECGVHFPLTVAWDSESYLISRSQSGEPISAEDVTDIWAMPLYWSQGTFAPDNSPYIAFQQPFFLLIKPAKHQLTAHSGTLGFTRVGYAEGPMTAEGDRLIRGDNEVEQRRILEGWISAEADELKTILLL